MDADPELERWQREWRAHEAIPASLARRVERERRHMWWGVLAEVAVTIAIGGGSLAWAMVSRRTDVAILSAGVWIIIAIAWTTSIVLRRGAWQPATTTTAAFMEVSVLRCERRLLAVTAQAALYVLILVFDLVWLYAYSDETSVWTFLTRPAVVIIAWGGTLVTAAAGVWYRRRLMREMQALRRLRSELEVR